MVSILQSFLYVLVNVTTSFQEHLEVFVFFGCLFSE